MLRRVFVGTVVLFALSVWSWSRGDESQAQAGTADPVRSATAADHDGGTHDEAFHRFQTNQSRHWRQVAIGR
jgi:hypothetical protein